MADPAHAIDTSMAEKYYHDEVEIETSTMSNIVLPNKYETSFDDSTPVSNSYEQSPTLDSSRTPFKRSSCSQNEEIIDVPILQKQDNNVFISITFPTSSVIKNVKCVTNDTSESVIQYQVASPYGITSGSPFNEQTKFLSGDYCIGIALKTIDEANKILSVKLHLILEPISNLMVSQMIFGLYRSLGFEPSHILKFPVKSVSASAPFYRKTRGEINGLSSLINSLDHKLSEVINKSITPVDTFSLGLQLNEISSKLDVQSRKLHDEPHTIHPKSNNKSIESKLETLESKLNEMNNKNAALESILNEINNKLNTTNEMNNKLDEFNTKLSNNVPLEAKLDEISTKLNNNSFLEARLDQISNNSSLELKLDEINTKLDNNSLFESQFTKLHNKIKELRNTSWVEELKVEIGQVQEQLDLIINKESDVEKGSHDVQSMTISDLEKLMDDRDSFFNKLVEAEEHIDYLQSEIEEAETLKQQALNKSKSYRPNFVRKNQISPQWM